MTDLSHDSQHVAFTTSILDDLGNELAHELRTPLSAIRMGVSGIKEYFPILLSAYKESVKNQATPSTILPKHLALLEKALDIIEAAGNRASCYVNTLVSNLTFNSDNEYSDKQSCSILKYLAEVLDEYASKVSEKAEIISIDNQFSDFECLTSPILLKNLFNNLLRYIIYLVEHSDKKEMHVLTEVLPNENRLYFTNFPKNFSGFPTKRVSVLNEFLSKDLSNIGLFYCSEFMTSLGGAVLFCSNEENQIEVMLSFPILKIG